MSDESNYSQNMTKSNGTLLQIANNILKLNECPSELENEVDLFLRRFLYCNYW